MTARRTNEGTRAVVMEAYVHLLTHSAGTEAAVRRLRALRRAERQS